MSEREPPIDGDALAGLLRATRESLQAFQATQAKTAEVHAEFLRSHAKASECFTTLFETHARLVELATGGAPGHARSAVFAPSPPTSPASSSRPGVRPISAPRAAPQELVLPDNSAPHVRASDDLPPELSASTLTAMIKEGVALPNPSSHGAPSAAAPSTIDPLQMVIDIVAVKTGYPPDLLSGGLDLETDLGVDSIKRVEIVGTLQDSLPSDVELDADHLATLRTLDDIADHVRGLLGESATAPNAPPSTAPIAASTIAPIAADVAAVDVAAVLIETVAQRTGYPSDLLQLDMDLETDLGVDSIKRVEIVSALQEALPSLPDIDSDELATLRTLAEIAAYVQALVPDQRAASQAVFAPLPLAPELPGRPARSPGTALNVRGIVFDTIASRTGFPSDLLGVAMDLEGDLGIDSIKRVEIMSALAEALPEVGELDGDVISGLRTIGEIVDHLKALAGGAPSAKVEQDVVGVPDDAPDIVGLLRREVVIGPAEAGEAITLGGACVVTRDHLGLAERLAAELRALGVDAGVIDPDWTSDSAIRACLNDNTRSVVHAAALGARGLDLRERVRGGFLLARAAIDARLFATLTGMGGTFGMEAMLGDPLQGALCGLAKTVAQERPGRRALALDVDPDHVDIQALADELMTDRGVVEVGLGERLIGRYDARVRIDHSAPASVPLQAGDLVVVTGGARGVTAAVVMEMARRWQPTFLLLGRSHVSTDDPLWADGVPNDKLKPARIGVLREEGAPFNPQALEADVSQVLRAREVRETLDAIRGTGCMVAYSVADVRDQDAIFSAIGEAQRVHGPVRGVVHGAGVIADKLIEEKSEQQFDLVFETKVHGLQHVMAACSVDDLSLFAVFSSVAGRYGNRGQVDYSMANEAITHVAKALSGMGVPHVKAFHWGPWQGGMVSPSLAAAFAARGLMMIGLDEGANAFCDEFERGGPAVEVVIGGPPQGGALIGAAGAARVEREVDGSAMLHLDSSSIYLDDHRIEGQAVLPFVMAVEFMVSNACRACPDLVFFGIRDVSALKGVVLDANAVDLTLRWQGVEPSPGAEVALAFDLVGQPNKLGLPTVHYRGTVDLGLWGPSAARHVPDPTLCEHSYPLTVDEAYRAHLFHGPAFRGIQRIEGVSERGLVATVLTSVPSELGVDAQRWCTDPVALDSALQLVGLWVQQYRSGSALPVFIERYQQVAPLRGELLVAIEMAPTKTSRGSFDVSFVDSDGRTVASLTGGQYTAMAGEGYRRGAE